MESAIDRGRRDLLAWDADRPKNLFDTDHELEASLRARLGAERLSEIRAHLSEVGAMAGGELYRLGRETNREENLPRLERYDGLGVRTESVVFHPSYHEAGRLIWQTGVLAGYATPGNETEQLAMLYMMAQDGECGHLCPLACTAGLIKVLQAVGAPDQKERWLPRLLSPRYDERLHASQFLTEVQGGSDVGANAVIARRDGDAWRIHGEKWFCSVIDAQVFLMTARPEGAPAGTKGLGLFLVPRAVAGEMNRFFVRRLKWKLGTKAMASAEADFEGAWGEQVGAIDRGFKNVVEHVLDTSRVYNAVCCAGGMRRSYVEAATYARHRRAFGQPIASYPLVQEALATMRAEAMAALSGTLRIARTGDRLATSGGGDDVRGARRMAVNANKMWTSVRNTQMARLAIEIFGGNGAIESFSLVPQLYRDAMVLESWEGTHNTLVAQIVRDAERLNLHEPFLAELREAIGRLEMQDRDRKLVDMVSSGVEAIAAPLARLAAGEGDQRWGRRVVDQMAVTHALVAMLEELALRPDDDARRGAIELLATRDLSKEIPPPPPVPAALL